VYNVYYNNNERSKMTLEEFKEYVEMRQKISLEEALSRLKPKDAWRDLCEINHTTFRLNLWDYRRVD
jgi:hypothetical protein